MIPELTMMKIQWDRTDAVFHEQESGIMRAILVLAQQRLEEVTKRRDFIAKLIERVQENAPEAELMPEMEMHEAHAAAIAEVEGM